MKKLTILLIQTFLAFNGLCKIKELSVGYSQNEILEFVNKNKGIYTLSNKQILGENTSYELRECYEYYPERLYITYSLVFKKGKCIKIIKWIPYDKIGYLWGEYMKKPEKDKVPNTGYEMAWINRDTIFCYVEENFLYGQRYYAFTRELLTQEVKQRISKIQADQLKKNIHPEQEKFEEKKKKKLIYSTSIHFFKSNRNI